MQFAQRIGMLNGHFGGELTAAFAGSHLFTPRTAIDIAAAFQFDQVTAVTQDNAFIKEGSDRFHVGSCGLSFEISVAGGRDSRESATAAARAKVMPTDSRQPIRSPSKRMAIGILTSG